MLNSKGERELAFLTIIDGIEPIEGYDKVETALVGGWRCIVPKSQFKHGDIGVYFEIDSLVPSDREYFAFLEKRKYRIKTLRMCKTISQGLLMHPSDFGWKVEDNVVIDSEGARHKISDESRFFTQELGVTYYSAEDRARKGNPVDKYKAMAQRRPEIFKRKWARWLMRREWGRRIMFAVFGGKKKKSETAFPTKFPYIKKTDQERCENMIPWVLKDKTPYIVTQKCDGSSATYIVARTHNPFKPFEFYVCSRNVRMLDEKQQCFYDDNVYWEMAKKYNIEEKLKNYLKDNPHLTYVCWQGEICGPNIQKNPHHLKENHLFCFHMIDSKTGKYDMRVAERIWISYGMEIVPIVDVNYRMPDDFEEFKQRQMAFIVLK